MYSSKCGKTYQYARLLQLGIENFRGVFMRDTLHRAAHDKECGIVNFNTSHQRGQSLGVLFQRWYET